MTKYLIEITEVTDSAPEVKPEVKRMEFRFHYVDGTHSGWGQIQPQMINWTGQMNHHPDWTIQKVEFREAE
jgi:hypothetical protein